MEVHIVVKGDTLWKIARQYGISFEDLKRVNAHLANPDYIVPGMKIFLPAKKNMPHTKGPEKKPQPGNASTPATPVKPPTQTKPTKPMQPIPLPPMGGEQEKPMPPVQKPTPPVQKPMPPVQKPTPPVQKPMPPVQKPTPPVQKPMPPVQKPTPPVPIPPLPPAVEPCPPEYKPPVQPMPMPQPPQMPQYFQPIIPVPCGWMPIYDADCYPMTHHGMTPAMPMPDMSMPMQSEQDVMPTPPMNMGITPPQIDMSEEMQEFDWEESPIYPGMGVGTPPSYPTSGWEMMESPEMPEVESTYHMEHYQPESGYVPQMMSPEYQNPYGMMMHPQQQFWHCQPCPPIYHHGCHPHHGHFPMPLQGMPMQQMPMQWMPMQQMPMNQAPYYNQPNKPDCGCS